MRLGSQLLFRGSVEIIKLLLYYGKESEYSPKTCSIGRTAGKWRRRQDRTCA